MQVAEILILVGAVAMFVMFLLIMHAILEEATNNRCIRMSPDEEFAWIKSTSPGMSDEEIQEIVNLPWPSR